MIKISFLPKTRLGKWSVILAFFSFVLFVVGSVSPMEYGITGYEMFIQNPRLTIITILLFFASIATSIMGLISGIKNKERSILVFLAIPLGLFSILGFFVPLVYVFWG